MSKTVIILALLAGSCVLCGGGLAVLGLVAGAADGDVGTPPMALSGAHATELVGFWDSGSTKLALFSDGSARKWVRFHWDGKNTGNTCKLEGDLTGSWSGSDGQLSLAFTAGRWVDCRGEQEFKETTQAYSYRFTSASAIDKKVIWLRDERGETGYNLECEAPSGCRFEPTPIP